MRGLGRRCAARDADIRIVGPPLVANVLGTHQKVGNGPTSLGDFAQSIAVRRRLRAYDEHELTLPSEFAYGNLPVGRRVANVLLLGSLEVGETSLEHRKCPMDLLDAERRLGQHGEPLMWRKLEALGVLGRFHENHPVGCFPHRAFGASPIVPSASTCPTCPM